MVSYDPSSADLLTFHDKIPAFLDGSDTPRAYLERCLEIIEAREPDVKAFVTMTIDPCAPNRGRRYRALSQRHALVAARWHANRHQRCF
jgi:hypothetical protein